VISPPMAQMAVLPYCSRRLPTAFSETLQKLLVGRCHLRRRPPHAEEFRADDPVNFLVVAVALLFVALLASVAPAVRALRVDPLVALRHD
jgi:hypothetical protein